MKTTLRIGNAQAFWGDRGDAAYELLAQEPDLDFLTMDYLAEVSMSILARQRDQDPSLGYARDFVEVVRGLTPYWSSGGKCRLVVNAGGLNPIGCAEACYRVLSQAGCGHLKIGVVDGDDVLRILQDSDPKLFPNLDSGREFTEVRNALMTANAYLGCEGIVQALKADASIIITGRVADPSLVVGPCAYSFQWKNDQWNELAGATVAGHLIECGTHVTGGIATDWLDVPNNDRIGFPIVEVNADGSCVVTKSKRAGGRVSLSTVKEQLIYEIGDPGRYLSPDVSVSFLSLKLEEVGPDRVRVSGAIGSAPPPTLKVSATYRDGYRAAGTLTLFGLNAVEKGRRCGRALLDRLTSSGCEFRESVVECLGAGDSVLSPAVKPEDPTLIECVLRIGVESSKKEDVERFTKAFMPLVTAGPQGTTGYAEGRPKVHSVVRYWPCLINYQAIRYRVQCIGGSEPALVDSKALWPPMSFTSLEVQEPSGSKLPVSRTTFPANTLGSRCFGRSGDKGIGANVGILVRNPEDYPWLCEWLTEERVQNYFAAHGVQSVERFRFDALLGINFILRGVLRSSVRNDVQGKALAQALLLMPLNP